MAPCSDISYDFGYVQRYFCFSYLFSVLTRHLLIAKPESLKTKEVSDIVKICWR